MLLVGCSTTQVRNACIGAGLSDAATTAIGMKQGASETNPLIKASPVIGVAVGTALVVVAAESLRKKGHEKTARWLYGACAVLHGGAATWNAGQIK